MSDALAFSAGCCFGIVGWCGAIIVIILFFNGASKNKDRESEGEAFKATQSKDDSARE